MVKTITFLALLIAVSDCWCSTVFEPISGEAAEAWNSSEGFLFPTILHFPVQELTPDVSIYELRIGWISVGQDSLNIYLYGLSGDDVLLLAAGGYKGSYNFVKSGAMFEEIPGLISLHFQMPYSAGYCGAEYSWDMADGPLVLEHYVSGDPSQEAREEIEILLDEGKIDEAADILSGILYPGRYYEPEEMFCCFLRSIHRAALIDFRKGNHLRAVDLFINLSHLDVLGTEWFPAFEDSISYTESEFARFMEFDEYIAIMNDYGFFLEQADDPNNALIVLTEVVDLKPSRMVARLNLADVMWQLENRTDAAIHYRTYLEMMTAADLTDQIPERVFERTDD